MGTNYYYHEPDTNHCPHCGRCDEGEVIHIGKSSYGWVFALHVHACKHCGTCLREYFATRERMREEATW